VFRIATIARDITDRIPHEGEKRGSFGNRASAVQPAEVKETRLMYSYRKPPCTEQERQPAADVEEASERNRIARRNGSGGIILAGRAFQRWFGLPGAHRAARNRGRGRRREPTGIDIGYSTRTRHRGRLRG